MLISLRVKQRAVIDRVGQVSRTIRMEKNVLVFELQMEHERFLLNYSVHLDYSVFIPEGTEKKYTTASGVSNTPIYISLR